MQSPYHLLFSCACVPTPFGRKVRIIYYFHARVCQPLLNAKCPPPTIRKDQLRHGPEDEVSRSFLLGELGKAEIVLFERDATNCQRETCGFTTARQREIA